MKFHEEFVNAIRLYIVYMITHTSHEVIIMKQSSMVEELNQLLKGSYMGIQLFKSLQEQLESEQLIKEFHQILDKFHMHAHSLTALIQTCHEKPVENAGAKGILTSAVEMIKDIMIVNDRQVLQEAVKHMDTAIHAIEMFLQRHQIENEKMVKIVRIMQEDYESIDHLLRKYLIEFSK